MGQLRPAGALWRPPLFPAVRVQCPGQVGLHLLPIPELGGNLFFFFFVMEVPIGSKSLASQKHGVSTQPRKAACGTWRPQHAKRPAAKTESRAHRATARPTARDPAPTVAQGDFRRRRRAGARRASEEDGVLGGQGCTASVSARRDSDTD